MKRRNRFLFVLVIAASAICAAQEPSQLTLKVGVDLVNVLFTITDRQGRLVSGLTRANFAVEEDGRKQDILHLAAHGKLTTESGRKAIILISDGEDTSSKLHLKDAVVAAHKSDAVVYSIYNSLRGRSNRRKGLSTLRALSQETGGGVFELDRDIDFQPSGQLRSTSTT